MKYLFLVSMAFVLFAVSCAKKDNKQKVGKSGTDTNIDCGKKENEKNEICIKKAKDELEKRKAQQAGENRGDGSVTPERPASGSTTTTEIVETIPNLKSLQKMSITLNNKTALVAAVYTKAQDNLPLTTKVTCLDLKDIEKVATEVTETNPDDLKPIQSQLFLFDNSSIVADMRIAKGNGATIEDKPKLFMLTCNSGSKTVVADYANNNKVATRKLKKGQSLFESVSFDSKAEIGVLTSFECGDDEQILSDRVKILDSKFTNRIRLKTKSAVMVYRAVNQKFNDKKLSESGSAEQKNHEFSIVSCEG